LGRLVLLTNLDNTGNRMHNLIIKPVHFLPSKNARNMYKTNPFAVAYYGLVDILTKEIQAVTFLETNHIVSIPLCLMMI
jgi:hypothetical protein